MKAELRYLRPAFAFTSVIVLTRRFNRSTGQTLMQAVMVKPDPRGIPDGAASTTFSPNAASQWN